MSVEVMIDPSRKKRPLLIALLLSVLLVHAPLFLLLFFFSDRMAENGLADDLKKNAIVIDLKSLPELPVADIAKPEKEEAPDKATVQSLYNAKAAQETTSNGRKPALHPGPIAQKPAQQRPALAKPLPKRVPPVKPPAPKAAMPETPVALPSKPSLQDELRALKNQELAKEERDFKKFESKLASMTPPTNFGGGGEGEYLPDFKVGGKTYVNALANPQIAYYVELKRKFKMTWNPVPALRAQINQITKGKITVVLGVSLDADGKLSELRVLNGSGLSAYDGEARRTVAASAPFSRPPPYLLQKDGQVHMAWTFVVYL